MPTTRDTNERRQAIWPWLLMPIVVLLVFYTLQRFQDQAKRSTAVQPEEQTVATSTSGP